jgi:hypothetical protein
MRPGSSRVLESPATVSSSAIPNEYLVVEISFLMISSSTGSRWVALAGILMSYIGLFFRGPRVFPSTGCKKSWYWFLLLSTNISDSISRYNATRHIARKLWLFETENKPDSCSLWNHSYRLFVNIASHSGPSIDRSHEEQFEYSQIHPPPNR